MNTARIQILSSILNLIPQETVVRLEKDKTNTDDLDDLLLFIWNNLPIDMREAQKNEIKRLKKSISIYEDIII